MCPPDASTLYLPFKYLEIVFALEGDSTIIRSIFHRAAVAAYRIFFDYCKAFSPHAPLIYGNVSIAAKARHKPFYLKRGKLGKYFKRSATEL